MSITGGEVTSTPCDGMVAVYSFRSTSVHGKSSIECTPIVRTSSTSDNSDDRIHVVITDGGHTYYKW